MTNFDPKVFDHLNRLRCMECGHETSLLNERYFKCSECGGLYDVVHPFQEMQENEQGFRLELADNRLVPGWSGYSSVSGSGVWAFQELILPGVPSENLATLGERITLVRVKGRLLEWIGGDVELWLALEGLSPTGAFKDFGMPVAVTVAWLARVPFIICASTGDTSAAAAAYAARMGVPAIVLLPKGQVTPAQLVQPYAHGARIIEVPGDFDACMRILKELVAHHGAYPVNSLNPARIEGHQATVFQTWIQFGKLPDWYVLPLGNGSNTTSAGKGQDTVVEISRLLGLNSTNTAKILSVQPKNAAPLGDSFTSAGGWKQWSEDARLPIDAWMTKYHRVEAGQTFATAAKIGDPVSFRKVMRAIDQYGGGVTSASDEQAREAMFAAGASGFMVCPQTGVALAGLRWAVQQKHVRPGSKVVVVSTAHGLKFASDFEPQGGEKFTEELPEATTAAAAKLLGL